MTSLPTPAPNPDSLAAHALSRFGLGARPGDLARISTDARGWALAQVTPAPTPPPLAGHEGSAIRVRDMLAARKAPPEEAEAARQKAKDRYKADATLRTRLAISTDQPLVERLVQFWSNHFTVSTQRGPVAPLALPYETEAIRPHVLGRFRDMARAAILHPAMLVYLDNIQSIGPDSRAGQRRDKGLNENLGREALELHLLGVDGGYGQDDVRAMAMILTGWTIDGGDGASTFNANRHQPGGKRLLGQTINEAGAQEAAIAIDYLCAHPATARHIATQLARHFIADAPPPAAVKALETAFRDSDGDLRHVTRTLIALDAAWAHPLAKIRSPNDFVIAVARGTGIDIPDPKLFNSLSVLGQQPFAAPSPAGWPDRAADWTGPDALMRRIDWSLAFAQKAGGRITAADLLDNALGPLADDGLRRAVARAPSAAEALGLALSSPAFQRR